MSYSNFTIDLVSVFVDDFQIRVINVDEIPSAVMEDAIGDGFLVFGLRFFVTDDVTIGVPLIEANAVPYHHPSIFFPQKISLRTGDIKIEEGEGPIKARAAVGTSGMPGVIVDETFSDALRIITFYKTIRRHAERVFPFVCSRT